MEEYDITVLSEYCITDNQLEIVKAVLENDGNCTLAASQLGKSSRRVQKVWKAVKERAAIQGYSPDNDMYKQTPNPFYVKGTSTNYNADGQIISQWVKTNLDRERQYEALQEWVASLTEDIKPRPEIQLKSKELYDDLLNLYTITDAHVGMLAWHEEGGDDWDLKIAEKVLLSSFKAAIDSAPASRVAFVNQLGDYYHTDGVDPVTPTSGHLLDVDSRFAKTVKIGNDILEEMITLAAEKHEKVIVLMAEGNHDISTSILLQDSFARIFRDNPRVEVIQKPLPYYVYQHGEVMLGFHHGHKKKKEALPLLFATEFAKIWGETRKRYVHTGHMHHLDIKEHSGMRVIQHSTLTARDAHAARGGWHSQREMTTYTYHKKHGQVASNTVIPEMFD